MYQTQVSYKFDNWSILLKGDWFTSVYGTVVAILLVGFDPTRICWTVQDQSNSVSCRIEFTHNGNTKECAQALFLCQLSHCSSVEAATKSGSSR